MRLPVRYLLALATLAACGHSDPFTNGDFTEHGPFGPVQPLRLTYNAGIDAYPFFVPGDSLIGFAFHRPGIRNSHQCFGLLPSGGGTTVSESCPRTAASLDSTELFLAATPLTADSAVMIRANRLPGLGRDDYGYLGRAPIRDATSFSIIQQFPFTGPRGEVQFTPSHVALPGDGMAAYVPTRQDTSCPGAEAYSCEVSALVTFGLEVATVPLGGGAVSVLSGTELATSVAAGRSPGSVIFTLPLDSRVYERSAGGTIEVIADLGPYARDVMLRGNRIVGVVGAYELLEFTLTDSTVVQIASPGDIAIATVGDLSSTVVIARGLYRRPYLSGDGSRIVAESAPDLGEPTDLFILDLP